MRYIKELAKKSDIMRDLYGTYHLMKAWVKYTKNPPYRKAISQLKNKNIEKFTTFFTQVEIQRRSAIQSNGINLASVERSDKDGKEWVEFLGERGLTAQSTVLDYGCGSLRLGKSMINFLDVGNYTGVDISDHFYSLGIENYLGESLKETKSPSFYVIDSDQYKSELKDKKFDFIYSQWVMMHVQPSELEHYFENIFNQMHEESQFFFDYSHSIITLKQNALTWGYPTRIIKKIIEKNGFKCERVIGNMLRVVKA